MREQDRNRFAQQMAAVSEIYDRPVGRATAEAWFSTLRDVSIEDFERGMLAHLRDPDRGQFAPKPADILAQIRGAASHDGRPEADEAFALLPKAEGETAVWTAEMATAWYAGASDLYATDRVGSRMAFRASYERLVRAAREAGVPVGWSVTTGFDVGGREAPIRKAIADGRLPASAARLLPAPQGEAPGVLLQLIRGKTQA